MLINYFKYFKLNINISILTFIDSCLKENRNDHGNLIILK